MGFENPLGEIIRGYGRNYQVIGVVNDMITQSLYEPTKPTIFVLDPFDRAGFINVRIASTSAMSAAIGQLNQIFIKYNPNTPFEYRFTSDEFLDKYLFESRVGNLVGVFTILAIFISSLGLFGLASFVAEQRTKEIGIRKVLGASVPMLWRMLSKDFVGLAFISCCIAIPVGYYFAVNWLEGYEYRTPVQWWIFLVTCLSALAITLTTVSYQAIKAAMMSPVNSLKSE